MTGERECPTCGDAIDRPRRQQRFCSLTCARRARPIVAVEQRFWRYVDKTGEGCWIWTGYVSPEGYGQFTLAPGQSVGAHRYAYELLSGPIGAALCIDHLCRIRNCVNPAHLEPVTRGENTLRSPVGLSAVNARKTHCKHGHAFTADNTRVDANGHRGCRACHSESQRRYLDRRAS